jgi:DNA polymerase-3 subunit alpha
MLTVEEVSDLYHRDNDAFTNASLIAASVQPDILDGLGTSTRRARKLPGIEDGEDIGAVFVERVREAFDREFDGLEGDERALWSSRLQEEIDIIAGNELEDTFLQFGQIVNGVRREAGTPGPATGLRLQSLCAWLLGITAFNPYTVDPHFHPFFDERERANHILDLQVPTGARARSAAVMRSLFDEDGMGYVPAVEHITAARSLKMIAKRLEHRPSEFDEVLGIASRFPGASLQDLVTQNKRIGWLYKRSALLREAISYAAALEGLPYGFVRSRRTLIISPTPIGDFLGRVTNPDTGDLFIQSTRDSFPIGSISRVDMSTLSALAVCERLGVGHPGGVSWEGAIGHDDIYRRIAKGDLDGVYLLEADLMQRLAGEFGISSFDDLVSFLALIRYRRGGSSLAERVSAYRDEKESKASLAPAVADVVASTGGWALFDDQLRDIVRAATGLDPLNAAQMVRRFARQRPGELATLRNEFMMFAVEYGTQMDTARAAFTRVLRSAGATVPRQQIIGEAMIVGAMLYLSKRHPVKYFAALVNVHQGNESKREAYLGRLRGAARMLPVDIARSGLEYSVEHTGVRPPLWSIAGIGEETARKIVEWRWTNKLSGPREFDCLVADTGITYKVIEALVGAGALKPIGISAFSEVRRRRQEAGRVDRAPRHAPNQLAFDLDSAAASRDSHTAAPTPAGGFAQNVGNKRGDYHVLTSLTEFHPHPVSSRLELAGRISDLRSFATSSNEPIEFFMLHDSDGSVPIYVSWERVDRPGEPLADGDHVSVRGTVRIREGRRVCDADEIVRIEGGINSGEATPDQSAEGDP